MYTLGSSREVCVLWVSVSLSERDRQKVEATPRIKDTVGCNALMVFVLPYSLGVCLCSKPSQVAQHSWQKFTLFPYSSPPLSLLCRSAGFRLKPLPQSSHTNMRDTPALKLLAFMVNQTSNRLLPLS